MTPRVKKIILAAIVLAAIALLLDVQGVRSDFVEGFKAGYAAARSD